MTQFNNFNQNNFDLKIIDFPFWSFPENFHFQNFDTHFLHTFSLDLPTILTFDLIQLSLRGGRLLLKQLICVLTL